MKSQTRTALFTLAVTLFMASPAWAITAKEQQGIDENLWWIAVVGGVLLVNVPLNVLLVVLGKFYVSSSYMGFINEGRTTGQVNPYGAMVVVSRGFLVAFICGWCVKMLTAPNSGDFLLCGIIGAFVALPFRFVISRMSSSTETTAKYDDGRDD